MCYSITLNSFWNSLDAESLLVCSGASFAIFLSWVGMSTSGHTKRVTVNAVVLIGYSVGNAVGPFIWQAKYKPRNKVPFAIISACSVASAFTLLVTRQYLAYQNKKRDEEAAAVADKMDKYDEVYITVMEDGRAVEKKVDRVRLMFTPSVTLSLIAFLDYFFRLFKISRTFRTESFVTSFRIPHAHDAILTLFKGLP